LKQKFKTVPITALTATASDADLQHIIQDLGIHGCSIFRKHADRRNLFYDFRLRPLQLKELESDIVDLLNSADYKGSGIIYVPKVKEAEQWAATLERSGIKAGFYCGGDTGKDDRDGVHCAWLKGEVRVVVATVSAFCYDGSNGCLSRLCRTLSAWELTRRTVNF
jgi:superfamily II DNA helicase RecQ